MPVYDYLNFSLVGNESSSIDAQSYSVAVEKSLSNQEVETIFTEVTSIFGTAESIKIWEKKIAKNKTLFKE